MSIDPTATEVVYPESDGKPMADNTLQWEWMVKIVGELREQYAGQQVFVAGDLFWYPVQGSPHIVTAPDGLVAFGRPPGHRGSYRQWEEDNVPPQVVFEVLSPGNRHREMTAKLRFYERYGVQEYYVIDPDRNTFDAHHRHEDLLVHLRGETSVVSPLLGIRIAQRDDGLVIVGPDGRLFQDREQRVQEIQEELRKTAMAFEEEHERAIQEAARAEQAQAARELLAAKLRELGVNPDDVLRPAG